MIDKVKIREYTSADRESVINLLRLNTPVFFSADEEKAYRQFLEHETDFYFVIELDKKVIGCGGINLFDGNTTATISWDLIHPEYHGKSLGSKLVEYRLKIIKTISDVQNIIVRTSQHTDKFYEKQGFVLKEVVKDFWAKGYDLYYMEYEEGK
jgi:ribosomal-protein-alanine N-acetyltransferase